MNRISTQPASVAPGHIQFLDSIQPPLPAGEYTLTATQVVKDLPGETSDPVYDASQQLLVDGPRFALNPAQIHMVYPPANQSGDFSNSLPSIVFSNFSLPWSREIDPSRAADASIDGDTPINQVPWMGLLTIYSGDLEGTGSKAGTPFSVSVSELVNPADDTVLPPDLGKIYGPMDNKVAVVDLDISYFQAISPSLEELPFLAHSRVVNTDGKVMVGMEDDGCFSVIIGNRLPNAGDQNTIYLVSYEGHQAHLHGSTIETRYQKIRLALLGSWQFSTLANRGSFLNLMEDLCKPGRGGVKLLQMPDAEVAGELSPLAKEALEIGYVPLQNDMRVGERATSWYRGPFVAAPTREDAAYGPYHFSDHAMHYDPEYGMFNHAYSAAWQIGRLLALSDAAFSAGFFSWRNDYLKSLLQEAKRSVTQKQAQALGAEAVDGKRKRYSIVAGLQHVLASDFSNVDWPKVPGRANEDLPGLLSDKEQQAIHLSGDDPILFIKKKIQQQKSEQ